MARIEYTWTRSELYNKDGIQILIARANENAKLKRWIKIENASKPKSHMNRQQNTLIRIIETVLIDGRRVLRLIGKTRAENPTE